MNDAWTSATKKVKGTWQVEIRRTFGRGGQLLVIVGLDGYNYNYDLITPRNQWGRTTKGYNVRLSSNQAVDLTWRDMEELAILVKEAKKTLGEMNNG